MCVNVYGCSVSTMGGGNDVADADVFLSRPQLPRAVVQRLVREAVRLHTPHTRTHARTTRTTRTHHMHAPHARTTRARTLQPRTVHHG